MAYNTYAVSKISKVSKAPHGSRRDLMNARIKYLISHIPW